MDAIFSQIEVFFFAFIRIIALITFLPFLGSKDVPIPIKMGMALMIGMIITPLIKTDAAMPDTLTGLSLGIIKEIFIGIAVGLSIKMVFAAFEIAGDIIGIQMGYALASVIDPQTSSPSSVMSQFYNISGVLLFFSMDAHLIFISAISESFALIPPYSFSISNDMMEGMLALSGEMFKIAVKIAAPVTATLVLANISMGVLSRTVPQLNIFIIGFPITILLGLVIIFISLPFAEALMRELFIDLSYNVISLLKAAGGGD